MLWWPVTHQELQWLFPCEKRLQGGAQTIDVGLYRGLCFAVLLGRSISWRAKWSRIFALLGPIMAGNAKVDEIEAAFPCHHHIRWFKIAEDNRLLLIMQIV